MTPVISLRSLSKRYGQTTVLQDVSLDVPQGSILGIIGNNGSGKTTLLKACMGLVRPSEGHVTVLGHHPQKERAALCRDVCYIPDMAMLDGWLRVSELLHLQREQEAGVKVSFPLYRTRSTDFSLLTGYRYKNIAHITERNAVTPTPDEGVLSGFLAGFELMHMKGSIYGISPEGGIMASVNYQHDNTSLGSNFTLNTLVGDTRLYLPVPLLQHHVLSLRAIGGVSSGDTLAQGAFQMGGDDIESEIMGLNSRQFFLRGYDENAFSGNRFAMASAEYRFPIWYPQRGLGGGWLFFDSLVGTAFYDIGNTWDKDTTLDDFKDSVGGELRINLGLQHGMIPLTLRLGYAKGLDEDYGESKFLYNFNFAFWL